jgi:hypothetical protein
METMHALTVDEVKQVLAGYDPATLASWYVEANMFTWPPDCPIAKPAAYDAAPIRNRDAVAPDRFRLISPLIQAIQDLTTEEDRSRAWWTEQMRRTVGEWETWWDSRGTAEDL